MWTETEFVLKGMKLTIYFSSAGALNILSKWHDPGVQYQEYSIRWQIIIRGEGVIFSLIYNEPDR